jgi:protein TonB
MKDNLFKSLISDRQRSKKWLLFPFSALFHALVIAAVVVAPLMDAKSSFPDLKVIGVMLAAPPVPTPPPPPAGPPAGKTSKRPVKTKDDAAKPEPPPRPTNSGLVAPVEVPDVIEDEDIGDFGFPDGVVGGVPGGVEGGVPGGVLGGLLTDTAQANNFPVTRVQQPRLIRQVDPQYPQSALMARIHGVVIIEAVTDIYGRVRTTRIISGHPLLKNAAVEAVSKWIYEPYIVNGIPKPVVFTVTVNFRLHQ